MQDCEFKVNKKKTKLIVRAGIQAERGFLIRQCDKLSLPLKQKVNNILIASSGAAISSGGIQMPSSLFYGQIELKKLAVQERYILVCEERGHNVFESGLFWLTQDLQVNRQQKDEEAEYYKIMQLIHSVEEQNAMLYNFNPAVILKESQKESEPMEKAILLKRASFERLDLILQFQRESKIVVVRSQKDGEEQAYEMPLGLSFTDCCLYLDDLFANLRFNYI